jgi:L-fuculose-phosphate aldolase
MKQTIGASNLRHELFELSLKLDEIGLNRGTSGNCSIRSSQGFLVTPSGTPILDLSPESMVEMDLESKTLSAGTPSSEWRFHKDIYAQKDSVLAIVHVHSNYATALSCFREDIPAFHYMIAVAGGDSIKCAPYALFGSQLLSDNALVALDQRKACLLSNHGMIVTGDSTADALARAVEVEALCQQYLMARQAGSPVLLTSDEMRDVTQQFKGYGNWTDEQKN